MVSPASRRRVCSNLMDRGFSRRLSCVVSRVSRSASRRAYKDPNPELRSLVLELALKHPRYGMRRIHALTQGVNRKAVHRIWKEEGLSLKMRKRRKLKVASSPCLVLAEPNEAWAIDFACERLEDGRQVRILGVLDCFTRECLLLKAAPSFPALSVKRELEWLFFICGRPALLVSDNGPEFRALSVDIERRFIQPGKPWQNGYIESFFGKLRDEVLSMESFPRGSDLEARLDEFQEHYNNFRPHSSLRGQSPARFREGLEQKSEAIPTF